VKISIRLFAVARQLAGADMVQVELPERSTVAELRRALAAAVPPLAAVLPQMLVAVGSDYARDEMPLAAGDEVACIPPVSGG
jgi:molybdopterin converting factor subunit 1